MHLQVDPVIGAVTQGAAGVEGQCHLFDADGPVHQQLGCAAFLGQGLVLDGDHRIVIPVAQLGVLARVEALLLQLVVAHLVERPLGLVDEAVHPGVQRVGEDGGHRPSAEQLAQQGADVVGQLVAGGEHHAQPVGQQHRHTLAADRCGLQHAGGDLVLEHGDVLLHRMPAFLLFEGGHALDQGVVDTGRRQHPLPDLHAHQHGADTRDTDGHGGVITVDLGVHGDRLGETEGAPQALARVGGWLGGEHLVQGDGCEDRFVAAAQRHAERVQGGADEVRVEGHDLSGGEIFRQGGGHVLRGVASDAGHAVDDGLVEQFTHYRCPLSLMGRGLSSTVCPSRPMAPCGDVAPCIVTIALSSVPVIS